MAYTENQEYLEKRLEEFGLDIQAATAAVTSGEPGFNIGFPDVSRNEAEILVKQLRSMLYSWLHCLGVKDKYTVKIKPSIRRKSKPASQDNKPVLIEIALRIPKPNYRGKFVLGTKVGETAMGSRSTVIMAEADTGQWDVMPDEESAHEGSKLFEILDGNEDAFPNDGFEEFKQQQSGVMPEGYNPKDIFPVPKEFVTPAGLKSIDDVELD